MWATALLSLVFLGEVAAMAAAPLRPWEFLRIGRGIGDAFEFAAWADPVSHPKRSNAGEANSQGGRQRRAAILVA